MSDSLAFWLFITALPFFFGYLFSVLCLLFNLSRRYFVDISIEGGDE